jgi:Cof subfamily protein (haloacid dehalogenase superfamily)
MQYQLLASDFDNTLVPFGEPKPRPAVVKAVKKLQAAGGRFVLSTGRGYCVVHKEQLGGIRFDYAITCNGACVVDKNGTIVAEHPLTNEEMYALVDFCEDYNYPLQFNYRDAYYAYCEYDALKAFYDAMPKSGLTCLDGEDQDRHLIDMPHAAFVVMPPQELAHFNEKFGHLNLHFMQVGGVGKDGWCCYDVVRGGMDKGVGLADLCEKIGLTLADAVAAGDSANDVGMLKAAGLGCCMSNGTPDAKAAADRVIGDVREDGLAALIEELWFDGPKAEPSGRDLGSAWGEMEKPRSQRFAADEKGKAVKT